MTKLTDITIDTKYFKITEVPYRDARKPSDRRTTDGGDQSDWNQSADGLVRAAARVDRLSLIGAHSSGRRGAIRVLQTADPAD